jgi:hypothetical protein
MNFGTTSEHHSNAVKRQESSLYVEYNVYLKTEIPESCDHPEDGATDSFKMLVNLYKTHGNTSQKRVTFILNLF